MKTIIAYLALAPLFAQAESLLAWQKLSEIRREAAGPAEYGELQREYPGWFTAPAEDVHSAALTVHYFRRVKFTECAGDDLRRLRKVLTSSICYHSFIDDRPMCLFENSPWIALPHADPCGPTRSEP